MFQKNVLNFIFVMYIKIFPTRTQMSIFSSVSGHKEQVIPVKLTIEKEKSPLHPLTLVAFFTTLRPSSPQYSMVPTEQDTI